MNPETLPQDPKTCYTGGCLGPVIPIPWFNQGTKRQEIDFLVCQTCLKRYAVPYGILYVPTLEIEISVPTPIHRPPVLAIRELKTWYFGPPTKPKE